MAKIKIPNLQEAVTLAGKTIARFPLATVCGITGTIAMCYVIGIDHQNNELQGRLVKLILVSGLGISLFTALQLIGENLKRPVWLYVIKAVGVVLLVFYYFSLPLSLEVVHIVRYALFFLVAHLLVSFAPYIPRFSDPGFWTYNKRLFLQILTAFFFSMVLFAGLALALVAVDNLFDINIEDRTYSRLFFIMMGVFSMLYFLGGVPDREDTFMEEEGYSKGLSIFTQYILIPLVGVYNIILYLYTIKIIMQWDWPRGWIAYLFVSYAVLGILSYLLIYPLATENTKIWLKTFSKAFFISLVPLVVVLFLAIYRRVVEYGLTENRYFLFLLDFWLFGIALYFIISKTRNIKFIPVTLAIITLLSSFGPWGALGMSVRDQAGRFGKIIGKKAAGKEELQFEEKKNLSSILTYLNKRQELKRVQEYFTHNIDSLLATKNASIESILLGEYNINYISEWESQDSGVRQFLSFTAQRKYHVQVHHREFLQFQNYQQLEYHYPTVDVGINTEDPAIELRDSAGWHATVDLKPLINRLTSLNATYLYDMEPEEMSQEGKDAILEYQLFVKSLNLQREEQGNYIIQNIEFDLFFTRKPRKK